MLNKILNKYLICYMVIIVYDAKKFGKCIKNLRKINKLTLYKLANELHISDNYLAEIENGKSIPSIELFISIINYFKITAENYSDFDFNINYSFTNIEYKFLYHTIIDYIFCSKMRNI